MSHGGTEKLDESELSNLRPGHWFGLQLVPYRSKSFDAKEVSECHAEKTFLQHKNKKKKEKTANEKIG